MKKDLQTLIVLGAGNFSHEAKEIIEATGGFNIACFVEGLDRGRAGGSINGVPVVWIEDIESLEKSHKVLCAISSPRRRTLVERVARSGFDFATAIAPSAEVSPTASIGRGCLISRGVIIGAEARIAEQVFINRGVLLGHDIRIEPYVTLSPGVKLGGRTIIGSGTFIGMGAIILEDVVIGENSVVGAGAVVTKDVPGNVQVLGIPARVTKTLPPP